MPCGWDIGRVTVKERLRAVPSADHVECGPTGDFDGTQSLHDQWQLLVDHGEVARHHVRHATADPVEREAERVSPTTERKPPPNEIPAGLLDLVPFSLVRVPELNLTVRC